MVNAAPEAPTTEIPDGLLARHGAAMARHAKAVALVSVLLAISAYVLSTVGVGGQSLFSRLELGEPVVAGEALEGRDLIAENDPSGSSVQALWAGIEPESPEFLSGAAAANTDLSAIPGVDEVLDPTTVGPAAISTGGDAALVTVTLNPELSSDEEQTSREAVTERLEQLPADVPGSSVEVTSIEELVETITDQVEADLKKGEGLTLPLTLIVMVLIFGGFAAAGIPLAGAVAAIAGGLISLLGFTYVIDLDITVVNVVTVLGLGLSIARDLLDAHGGHIEIISTPGEGSAFTIWLKHQV